MAGGFGSIVGSILGGVFSGGAGPAIGAGIGAAIPKITDIASVIADRLVPDPVKAAEVQKEIETVLLARDTMLSDAIKEQNAAQNAINLAEAQGNDRYSSRWRPTLGWGCVAAFIYQFLFAPLATWLGALIGTALGFAFPAPPQLTVSDFMPVLLAVAGLSASRSYERVSGVSTAVPSQLKR